MYNKKVLSKIDLGKQTKKDPFKGDIIYDSMGQWKFPGQPTRIPSNEITMEGVPYPVYGIDNTGYAQVMQPGADYTFPGDYVDEYPMAKKGGSLPKRPKKKNKKAWSRSIEATNILFTENPLFSQPKPRRNKVYDPNAKYFQEGGELPDDYQEFLDYSATAPENRQPGPGYFYGSPDEYDHYGMWEALGKPNSFEEALEMNPDWQQDEEGYYHGYSVNPYTGVFLKAGAPGLEEGDTKWMEIKDHYLSSRANESTPVYDTDLQRFKYVPNKQKGGTKSKSKRTKLPTLYISDPEEYRLRKAMYDDSLYMYQQNNSTKLPPPPKLEYDGPRGVRKHSPVKVTTDPIKKITDKNDTKKALLYSKAFPGDSPAFKNYQKKTGKKLPANLPMWIEKQTALYYPNYHYSNTNPTGKGFVPPGKDYVKEHQYRGLWKEPRQPVMFGEPESSVVTSTTYDEYPPIYVSDSNDPRIGMYTEAGNQILYKKPVTSKKNALKLKPKVAESKIPISESAPVSTQVPVQTENVLPIQKPLRDKMILPLGRSYSNETTDGSLEGGKTTYGQFEKVVDPRTGKIRYLPTGKKSNFITLEDPTFKEGGKLGPISLNSGKYAAKKYPFGKFSGVFTKQDGGYIETELTDAEIEEYRKGGFIVEDISVPTLTQAQKGGEASCPEGYIYDSANNTCIPTGEFEYIDDPNDARLQDYKMQDILYRYSQLPYKHKENLTAEDILSGDLNTSWNERLNAPYLSNEEKALLKNDLLDWEGSKAQVWNFNDKKQLQNFINSSAFTWTPNLDYKWKNDEELTGLIKKYPPTGYHAREYFNSYPYTDKYAYNQNVPNKSGYNHYVTPKTAFIEDEIDREKLKKIYPTLTDEEIDEHLKETREQPSYITNYLQAPHYYWNINNHDVEYREDQAYPLVERITPEEISNSHNPWQYQGLPKKGADSYLQESEIDNIQYQGDYIPTWSAPKKRYILRGAVPKPVVSESIQTEDITSTQIPLKDKMVLPLGRHYFNENINKGLQGGKTYYGEFEKIIDPSSGKVRYVPTGKKSKFRTLYNPTFQDGGEMYDASGLTPFIKAQTGLVATGEEDLYSAGELEPVTVKAEMPDWARFQEEYQNIKPWEDYLAEEKKKYLRRGNKALNKMAGLSEENFPESVEEKFWQQYNQKMNTYATRKLGKKQGFNPRRRGEWVDELSPRELEVVAQSKYGSKLNPDVWSRFLSGAQGAANTLLPGQPVNFDIPGYTKREMQEARENPFEAFELLAPTDLPGIAIANAATNANIENPSIISGETMANVNPLATVGVNPLLALDLAGIPALAKGIYTGSRMLGKGATALGKGAVTKLGSKSKKPSQYITEYAERPNDVIARTPGIPAPPLPDSQTIMNRYNQLINDGESVLTARTTIADEFGIDAITTLNNSTPPVVQPGNTGSIGSTRPASNQSGPTVRTRRTTQLDTDFRKLMDYLERTLENPTVLDNVYEIARNSTDPNYQLPSSFDDLVASYRNSGRYSSEDIDLLAGTDRFRRYFDSLVGTQQRSRNEYNNLLSDPTQNIQPMSTQSQDFIDQINRIAEQGFTLEDIVQVPQSLPIQNKKAAKTLSEKISDFKTNLNSAINKANIKLGEVIDKSKVESLKKPITPREIDDEVNKILAEGVGVKKGDVQIKVVTDSSGATKILIKPKEFFKKNKELIESTYGKGSYDEWIKTVSDDWIDSGYLGLTPTGGEIIQPRKFTDILSGKELKPTVRFSSGDLEVPVPGLKRAGDYPFSNWEPTFREKILDNSGISGEITQAYNKALKSKGYGAYSGGTGHLRPGAKRYVRELLNNRVEVMNPEKAEDLYRLLNDPSTLEAVSAALKNKKEPLPNSVHQAIQPLIFKYKRKGGSMTNDFIEDNLTQKEIDDLIAQGYTIEEV